MAGHGVITGRRASKEPTCPFCGSPIARPMEIAVGPGERGQGGTCPCGAQYLVDPTGKNVGQVMVQALEIVAGAIGKGMTELVPGEDYDEAILSYDWRTHQSPGVSKGFMDGYGRLYVVRVRTRTGSSG
jgi:hypothetical protein